MQLPEFPVSFVGMQISARLSGCSPAHPYPFFSVGGSSYNAANSTVTIDCHNPTDDGELMVYFVCCSSACNCVDPFVTSDTNTNNDVTATTPAEDTSTASLDTAVAAAVASAAAVGLAVAGAAAIFVVKRRATRTQDGANVVQASGDVDVGEV